MRIRMGGENVSSRNTKNNYVNKLNGLMYHVNAVSHSSTQWVCKMRKQNKNMND